MLLVNAKIVTVSGDVIEKGYIKIIGSLIDEVGSMEQCPADDERFDAAGLSVFPGFVDAHCHIGMWEDSLGFEGDDGNEETEPSMPHLRAVDAINPIDECFREALAAGITTVVTGPGSANPIGGQMAAVKTGGSRIDQMVVKAPLAIKMALGENPKTVHHGKGQSPMTRMATAAIIREQLEKARRYLEDLEDWENQAGATEVGETDRPEYDIKCESLIPLLKKEIPAHIHAHRADDIFTAIRLCREFSLDFTVVHCTQGHFIADVLAEEGVSALTGPLICDRSKPELRGLTPKLPALLQKEGVRCAIVTDHPVVPIQYLALCAGLAAKEGLPWEEAVKAITLTAAEICGLDKRVGSIEAGKDADLVLFKGDPLTVAASPEKVMLNGVWMK